MWNCRSIAALPTQTNANPTDIDTWTYADEDGTVGYILAKGTSRRMITSCGDMGEDWAIGSTHEFHHDQTGRNFGFWKVVGIVRVSITRSRIFETGTTTTLKFEGEVPARKLSHWVFK